jgi:hypothetical protein
MLRRMNPSGPASVDFFYCILPKNAVDHGPWLNAGMHEAAYVAV